MEKQKKANGQYKRVHLLINESGYSQSVRDNKAYALLFLDMFRSFRNSEIGFYEFIVLNADILKRYIPLYRMARVNEIDNHSSCLFAKSRSGTYPRFCLFALLAPGTYPRFLGSQGTYPPVFAHWTFVGTCRAEHKLHIMSDRRS